MKSEQIIKKVLGKNEFSLSEEIPITYIVNKGVIFMLGLLRGFFRKIGLNYCGKKLFIGKHVQLMGKKKINFGNNVRIENNVSIDGLSRKGIYFGDRVKIGANSKIIVSGSLSNLGSHLKIGDDTSFAENSFFGAAGGIDIGNDVIAGQNVRFHAENHNYKDLSIPIRLQGINRKGIKIGNNVWIGSGVVFLDGAEIGDGSIIAANSTVSKKFEANSVIAGTPAKVIKRR